MLMRVQSTALPSGLRVVTVPMRDVESVAMGFWVGVGGRHETRATNGICHFIEHLLFKGTKTRSAREISEEIEGHGGFFDAYTQEDMTCYYARVTADRTWPVFDVLSDMFLHPRFDPVDVEKERQVILEEIAMYKEQPAQHVAELLMAGIWPGHALGRPLAGTERSLSAMKARDLLAFKKQNYGTACTVVAFAGRVDHDAAVREVTRRLGRLHAGRMPRPGGHPAKRAPVALTLEARETDQVHLALGFRTAGRRDKQRHALKLLSVMTGELMSSRLFQRVREDHGLAYAIHSGVQLYDECGMFSIEAGLEREKSRKALDLIVRELVAVRERGPTKAELDRAKEYTVGQLRIGLESPSGRVAFAAEQILAFGRVETVDEIVRRIESVTREKVQAVARSVFAARCASTGLIVPLKDRSTEPALRSALQRL